jgi:predicted LPLAT superfamily acyltransferase
MGVVVAYFYLAHPQRRRVSREFLRRAKAKGAKVPGPEAWGVFRHFLAFSETALDKVLAWDPAWRPKSLEFHGEDAVTARLRAGQGVLLIGSHLGNLEVARALGRGAKELRITVLAHTLHAESFNRLLKETWPQSQVDIVQVSAVGPETVLFLRERIAQGGVVLITGDRVALGGQSWAWAPFLGDEAAFPVGPYVLASLLECPVFLFFCLGEAGRFRLHYEPFAERVELPRVARPQALAALARRYAARLEAYTLSDPLHWGNFYPFWREPEAEP